MLTKIIGIILLYLFIRSIFRLLLVSQTKSQQPKKSVYKSDNKNIIEAEYTVISKE
jgi:UPF0716 family protein affecting phage T7 exclusion